MKTASKMDLKNYLASAKSNVSPEIVRIWKSKEGKK